MMKVNKITLVLFIGLITISLINFNCIDGLPIENYESNYKMDFISFLRGNNGWGGRWIQHRLAGQGQRPPPPPMYNENSNRG